MEGLKGFDVGIVGGSLSSCLDSSNLLKSQKSRNSNLEKQQNRMGRAGF